MASDFRDFFRWVDNELALSRTEKEYHKHGFDQFLEPLKARIKAIDEFELIDEIAK
jgi:hypothetical protein